LARVGEPQSEKWDVHMHKGAQITDYHVVFGKWRTIDALALVS
jgi:hypothetical protein